jgi:hypothetical protein
MEEFLQEEIWPWNVVCLQFVPESGTTKFYTYATNKQEPTFRMKFFEEILTQNATNVLAWIMAVRRSDILSCPAF